LAQAHQAFIRQHLQGQLAMNKGKIAIVVAFLFAIYVGTAPYITLYQMKSAAEKRDGEALSEHIEFPSVRQSLKDQMNAVFMKSVGPEAAANNPFVALGAAIAGVMVDKVVESYVTPAGITSLMAGEKPKAAKGGGENNDEPNRRPLSDASMSYESVDKFVVKVKTENDKQVKLVLRRRGLDWKLTEVILPLDD
jgi:hypothetical protein